MKRGELKKLTRRELYEMAKAYGIAGRSAMAKDDLLDALARVSAKRVMPKAKTPKRRMAKRRKRRTVRVRTTKATKKKKPTSTVIQAPPKIEEPAAAFVDRGPELPNEYGEDKVVAMVRDPNWIYVYWDLSGGVCERLQETVAVSVWVVRVHNLDDGIHEDVPVLLEGGNWYLPVASDTTYRVDIGVLDTEGLFHLAASGRMVKTPPVGISEIVDEEWLIMEDEFRRLMDISGTMSERFAGSHFFSEIIAERRRGGRMHSAGVSSLATRRR
ncbi:MAG: DUF4912 domain-containing protein [Planctomycetes bacterium]|nr:DUF4912 domain-containing protein [Planctomycetota bacterium]